MKIVAIGRTLDSEKEPFVFVFDNDDEMNALLAKIASSTVKTSGMRLVPILPIDEKDMSPMQAAIWDVLTGLDGIMCNDEKQNDAILDEAIEKLNKIADGLK